MGITVDMDHFASRGYAHLGRIIDDDAVAGLLEAERRFRPAVAYAAAGHESRLLVRDKLCHHSVAVCSTTQSRYVMRGIARPVRYINLTGKVNCFTVRA